MGPVLDRLFSTSKMRAFAFVLLSLAAVRADSDPYTIGQVASGLTRGGVITGVDYSNGVVSGYGAIGNRRVAYANHAYSAPVAASYAVSAPVAAHVPATYTTHAYATPTYSTYGGYGHYYGKREADADAYTIGQVNAGLPAVNAYATGHPHNVGVVTTPVAASVAVPAVSTSYAVPSVRTSVAVPAVSAHVAVPATYTSATYAAPTYTTYGGYGHYYGKREAEADPEAYTIGQVNAGLHYANSYRSVAPVYSTAYTAGRLGYAGLGYTTGLGYNGVYYG